MPHPFQIHILNGKQCRSRSVGFLDANWSGSTLFAKAGYICRYCTKTTQVFFGHVFFSVTETDVTIKIYKEYSKMDWKRMKQTNSSSHWWSVSFVSFVTKQDVTVQKTCSKLVTKQDVTDQTFWNMLVTKQSETKWNDETYNFFFL